MNNKQILFRDNAHKEFYNQQIIGITEAGGTVDSYTKPLLYLLSLSEDTRRNFENLYNYRDGIKQEGMMGGWMTSSTKRVVQLAFNLYNGYTKDGRTKCSQDFTPYYLFCDEWAPYFVQAIQLRYPEYFRTRL